MTQSMLIAALAAPTTRRPWLRRRRHAGRIGLSRTMADLPATPGPAPGPKRPEHEPTTTRIAIPTDA
jgi:hypothetical protein